jgi:hypothetical protein
METLQLFSFNGKSHASVIHFHELYNRHSLLQTLPDSDIGSVAAQLRMILEPPPRANPIV